MNEILKQFTPNNIAGCPKNAPCNVRIIKGKVYWLSSMAIGNPAFYRNNDHKGASNEFLKWNKSGGKVLQGLVNRRKDEREVFLK